jgi:uroporphyrinogen-III decarboxylase
MTGALQPGDRLAGMDFAAHNAAVSELWRGYWDGSPSRTPVILGIGTRFFLKERGANPGGLTFREYSESPEAMFRAQLGFQRWFRHNVDQDTELGAPAAWAVYPDFQNYSEASWFGCPVEYRSGEVPDATPAFAERPEALMDHGVPGPFDGVMGRAIEYHERFCELAASETYLGLPVQAPTYGCGMGSDGPFTVGCSLFGPDVLCTLLAAEPERFHALMSFMTEAIAARMEAWRTRFGVPVPQDSFGMADDSIALISTRMYREHVLPYHRRLYDRFGTGKMRSIHLCGDATRHFVTLRDELGIQSFDTGFPVDFAGLRAQLGTGVRIQGGPHVALLRHGTPADVEAEVRRIMLSGVRDGGLFVLREGNNMAPETPILNLEAMVRVGRAMGSLKTDNGGSACPT